MKDRFPFVLVPEMVLVQHMPFARVATAQHKSKSETTEFYLVDISDFAISNNHRESGFHPWMVIPSRILHFNSSITPKTYM
jgi:hypothetical protein